MESNFSLESINSLLKDIEEKGSQILSEIEVFLEKIKLKREIYRVQDLIDDQYIKIGNLVYDLDRLDKDIEVDDFKEEIDYINQQKAYLDKVQATYERLKRIYPEEDRPRDDGKEGPDSDYVTCPKCQSLNSPYAAMCISCGKAL